MSSRKLSASRISGDNVLGTNILFTVSSISSALLVWLGSEWGDVEFLSKEFTKNSLICSDSFSLISVRHFAPNPGTFIRVSFE